MGCGSDGTGWDGDWMGIGWDWIRLDETGWDGDWMGLDGTG
jgi:hypothetical protein